MRRNAFTLIELLVTLIAGSVVMIGLASLLTQMLTDQRDSTYGRESYYSRGTGNMELVWTMRQVQRRGIRQGAAAGQAQGIDLADGRGGRSVITYIRDAYNQYGDAPQRPTPPVARPDPARRFTGIIFLYFNTLYKYEASMVHAISGTVGAPAVTGFNGMTAAQLNGWMTLPAHLRLCEVLATGVENFDVSYTTDATLPAGVQTAVRWNLSVSR